MRIGSLGVCLVVSVVLNLVGLAPLMNFLLGRGGASRPAPRPPVQVRLLNARVEPARVPSPVTPPPPEEKLPEPVRPKEKPKVATLPKDVKPVKSSELPEDLTPQAKPQTKTQQPKAAKSAQATPSGPLTRPDDKSVATVPPPGTGNAPPFTTPGNATTPVPGPPAGPTEPPPAETPSSSPSPSSSPGPVSDNTNPLPSQTPSSSGSNPNEGTTPEKPATPTSFPPNQFSRPVLRRLGGKSMVRVGLKIYPDGHLDARIVLSSGNAELDAAVLKDMKDWKWNPAEAGGKPVITEREIRLKLET